MVDYAYDDTFDIYTNSRGDWETVDGFEEFEQDVITELRGLLDQISGSTESDQSIHAKAKLAVHRVADRFDEIETVEFVNTEMRADNVFEVAVRYNSGETFTDTI
jgi:hypothetical protein